jgi:hypothetical protein
LSATSSIFLAASTDLLTINGSLAAPVINAHGASGLTLDTLASLNASATGDAIVLDAGGGNFTNNVGAGVMNLTGGGRWLVYSTAPSLDVRGGLELAYNFKQYNTAFGGTILGTGNGLVYTLAPTVTFGLTGAVSRIYDGTTTASLAAGNFLSPVGAVDGDTVSAPAAATGTFDTKNAGAGKMVTASGQAAAANGAAIVYGYQYSASGAVGTITPLALSGAAIAAGSSTYAAVLTPGAVSFANIVAGDSVISSASVNTATLSSSGNPVVGTYTQTAGAITGMDAANYSFAGFTSAANYTITPLALTIGATGVNRTYDGSTAATVTLADNRIAGDILVLGYTDASFIDSSAAKGKTVNVTGIALAGPDSANYTYNTTATTTADIAPVLLLVTANNATKIYDTVPFSGGNGVTYAGFVNGETSAVLGGTITYSGTSQGAVDAGSYVITPGGLTSSNYAVSYVDGILTIDPASVTVLAPNVIDEIANAILLLGKPETVSTRNTGSPDEDQKRKAEETVVVTGTSASTDATAQSLPVCP